MKSLPGGGVRSGGYYVDSVIRCTNGYVYNWEDRYFGASFKNVKGETIVYCIKKKRNDREVSVAMILDDGKGVKKKKKMKICLEELAKLLMVEFKLKEINETVRINDYNMTVEKMLLN